MTLTFEIFQPSTDYMRAQRRKHAIEAFKVYHGIGGFEFLSDHWQTLFAIQYPEARS